MIVSDRHRFIFVHIPKCAGTSVRKAINGHDDTGGAFANKIVTYPELGPIDVTHMPPALLARAEPAIYDKLMNPDYAAYAVLRDPYQRFPSSIAQRVKMFSGFEIAQADTATLHAELDRTMRHVSAHPEDTDPAYIHLRRQSDYVHHDGRQVVDRLYTLDRLDAFLDDIAARTGGQPERVRRANRTPSLRYPLLRHPARLAGQLVRETLPRRTARNLRNRSRRWLLERGDAVRPDVFDSAEVRAFIAEHYADDIALYERVAASFPEDHAAASMPA